MDHQQAGRYWNANAKTWTALARAGYDVYRDHLNTPAFFALLPDVTGLRGLDIGCGEGHNTRLLAQRGARMDAIDIAEDFVAAAARSETEQPLGIGYRVASAVALPYDDAMFDFATAFMSLMDLPETGQALAEAHRVLRPGGFLQFSITHPCFDTPLRRNLRDAQRRTYAIEVGDYFRRIDGRIEEWLFKSAPHALRAELPKFKVPRFNRTLGEWLNMLVDAGFRLERVAEPRPDDAGCARTHRTPPR
jgi:ubiquinone/menaquinone biosynthesis C-methylase UbiE